MKNLKKNAGENIYASRANWSFGGKIAKSFDDHINKSVPLYQWTHDLTLSYSDYFIHEDSIIYDIGCSTGVLINKIAQRNIKKKINLIGIDNQKNMISHAKKNSIKSKSIKFMLSDFFNFKFNTSSLFLSLFTIQFIHPSKRQELFDKVYSNLEWGGAFIFFEKVRGPDARFQDMLSNLYTEYKVDSGYKESEIIAKQFSLKGILEPFSSNENIKFIKRAGFKDHMIIFKFLCFEGYLAIK